MRETIDAFLATRLLMTNQVGEITTLEVGHEALLREWPRLVEWTGEASADMRLQQTISHNVAEWEQRGRPKDRLYRGARLKESLAWPERNTASGSEVAFLRASNFRRTRERISLLVIGCLILALLFPAGLIMQQRLFPLTVTTLQDGGPGSLRQTIGTALSGSTISFAPGLKGHISLTTGLEIATNNLTIRSPGANALSIDGASNADWSISIRAGTNVTISGLTFSQPKPAFGVFFINYGSLTLDKCNITNITKIEHQVSDVINTAAIDNTQGALSLFPRFCRLIIP